MDADRESRTLARHKFYILLFLPSATEVNLQDYALKFSAFEV